MIRHWLAAVAATLPLAGHAAQVDDLEAALQGLEVDMTTEVTLEPADAYGELDPALQMQVPLDAIPEEARQVGMELDGEAEDGSSRTFRVVALDDESITVDGNHPYAGRRLHFKFEVLDIREATPEEIEAGYGFSKVPRQ